MGLLRWNTPLLPVCAMRSAQSCAQGLYLVATPIGNLADASLRALAVLARADTVYCEDTRISQRLLNRYAIRRPLKTYHEHNAEKLRPEIAAQIASGASVALISDAGTPAISDPGFKLVRSVWEAGNEVIAVPGPSAVAAAISIAGLPTDRFLFAGFLPHKSPARRRELGDLANVPVTLVFYESPHRNRGHVARYGPMPWRASSRRCTRTDKAVRGSQTRYTGRTRCMGWRYPTAGRNCHIGRRSLRDRRY